MLDTGDLKQRIDIVELAGRYAALGRWSSGELAGPCPKCGGTDRFHVHADGWWKCYQCHDKRADVIELVQFLGLAGDFREGAAWLARYAGGGLADLPAPRAPIPAVPKDDSPWMAEDWQRSARAELAAAVARLASPAGKAARAYLAGRGLQAETWEAWGLGYAMVHHPKTGNDRAAIVMPWHWGNRLCVLKYRFFGPGIDDCEDPAECKARRFSHKKGSKPRLFGLQMRQSARALVLIEGELNALSVWQAARAPGLRGFDVISFGAESAGTGHWAAGLAARYQRVIVWTDEERLARDAMVAIPHALGKHSPFGLDANDLLRAGRLSGFLGAIFGEEMLARPDPGWEAGSDDWAAALG